MPMLVNNPELEEAIIADRRAKGIDQMDEVWEGVYMMAPLADDEHQELQARLVTVLTTVVDFPGLGKVRAGANITNRRSDWMSNFRVPDVLVFLEGTNAQNRHSHWFGGPDFAVEIISPDDRSREKLDFYTSVGVRELLIIDRNPWQLELFRLVDGKLRSEAIATEGNGLTIDSDVVPISLRLVHGQTRPGLAVTSRDGKAWTI
jgi:Uma2 family endonuclease